MSEKKVKSLREALAEFKQMELLIPKTKAAYGYNYAPLEVILPIITPILKSMGLDYQHTTDFNERGQMYLQTTVFFSSEANSPTRQEEICRTIINPEVKLAKMNEFMVIGSATTYFRRYHLVILFGLITDEDSDAGGGKADAGATIMKAKVEDDFVPTFKHQLTLGKTEKQIWSNFELYKKKMSNEQIKTIETLIKAHYENK
jgi:hypothetical protein